MSKREIVLIAHNIRSAHNAGSLLRTADGLDLAEVYLTGYTPYPAGPADTRLPHLSRKIEHQINKTALGAQKSVKWFHEDKIDELVRRLKKHGFLIAALEQTPRSLKLHDFEPASKIALIVGSEVGGLDKETLALADKHLEIPMLGKKESFNVAAAAAMALYRLRFFD